MRKYGKRSMQQWKKRPTLASRTLFLQVCVSLSFTIIISASFHCRHLPYFTNHISSFSFYFHYKLKNSLPLPLSLFIPLFPKMPFFLSICCTLLHICILTIIFSSFTCLCYIYNFCLLLHPLPVLSTIVLPSMSLCIPLCALLNIFSRDSQCPWLFCHDNEYTD